MRIRPVFWYLLISICVSMIVFAKLVNLNIPARLELFLDQPSPTVHTATTLLLSLTDPQGLPIDHAQVVATITMATMDMGESRRTLKALGQGQYRVQLPWSMAGTWVIEVFVRANGFAQTRRTLLVQVRESEKLPYCLVE
jgi:hypothetical protein